MLSGQCDVAVRVASKEVHSTTKVEEWHSRCQLASCQCECHWGAEGSAPKKRVWRLLPALGALMLLTGCDTTKVTQLGEVVFHGNPAPAVDATDIGTPVSFDRTPQLHADYQPCAELMVNNPACPQAPTHFDRIVEPLPDSCQLVVRQEGDYLRATWQNGKQQPCTPCVEHDVEVPETSCGKVVVP